MIEEKSLDVFAAKLAQLRELFPEVLTEGKIDFKRLRALLGDEVSFNKEHYELSWAGKSDARAQIQQTTSATLIPSESKLMSLDSPQSGNLFIEGENLEVLHVLQRSYFGKIKMIYIDPPYNTGNDSFVYPDDYSERQDEYKKRAGITDNNGFLNKQDCWKKNNKENGQFHSVWLSMMYPRLYLARNLLREDGVIFISIDDNEQANLKLLCDEIFGAENFVGTISWKNKYGAGAKTKTFIEVHEYILCYSKSPIFDIQSQLSDEQISEYEKNKDDKYAQRGGYITQPLMTNSLDDRTSLQYEIQYCGEVIKPRKQWVWSRDRLEDAIRNNEVVFKKKNDGKYSVRAKIYLKNEQGMIRKGKPLSSINGPFNQQGTQDVEKLLGEKIFSFPKPVSLLLRFFEFTVNGDETKDGIYLDFFSGSGTTAHAVLDLNEQDGGNRQFICVQLPEHLDENSEAYKAGYKTIADICKARINKVIAKIQAERDNQKQTDLIPETQKQISALKVSNSPPAILNNGAVI